MKPLLLTYKGETQTTKEWEEETGIPAKIIVGRKERNWTDEATLTVPVKKGVIIKYEWEGKMCTIPQLAKIHGEISAATLRQRLEKMSLKEAMEMPNTRPGKTRKKRITKKAKKIKPKPVSKKIDTSQCRTCAYRAKGLTCGYEEVTGHCRMLISKPSPNCTVYIKGESMVLKAVRHKIKKGMVMY